jgi:glycosyltransferase involved in cell wall biosynthesis
MKKYAATENQILQLCQNFIGRTEWDRAVVAAVNPQAKYFHCDEPLADDFYSAEWQPGETGKAIIYSTSGGVPFKGSLMLARAVAVLIARGWKDVELHLAGLNKDFDAGKLIVDYVREQHLEANIRLFDRVSPGQIVEMMRQASVYVHPSHIDNSPNSLCEAMLIGMPCVAARVGGVPSLVTDGSDGLLYHDRDVYMLADRIIRVLGDRALASRLGKEARRTAMLRHDREKIAAQTVAIYQQVLSPEG